ncbi:hypothetical protein ACFL1M_03700 [Patescibacteria group bacterium]
MFSSRKVGFLFVGILVLAFVIFGCTAAQEPTEEPPTQTPTIVVYPTPSRTLCDEEKNGFPLYAYTDGNCVYYSDSYHDFQLGEAEVEGNQEYRTITLELYSIGATSCVWTGGNEPLMIEEVEGEITTNDGRKLFFAGVSLEYYLTYDQAENTFVTMYCEYPFEDMWFTFSDTVLRLIESGLPSGGVEL